MKVVILAGGLGTRISEETDLKPKPMVEIGGHPILWHIMKIYSHYGFNDFIVCCGYKGYVIKEYFSNYFIHQRDVTIDLRNNKVEILNNNAEPWRITLIDTGERTMTGGRLKRIQSFIGNKTFMFTYGDGVANINIHELIKFHNSHDGMVSVTSVQPDGRFGSLEINIDNKVINFIEKKKSDGGWINAGYFVCESAVFDYITNGDKTTFEQEPLQNLSKDGKIYTYKHPDFWMPMDTLMDMKNLNIMWDQNEAPWRIWSK
jgi:glucose-1-phosphate cytidylyltransferase